MRKCPKCNDDIPVNALMYGVKKHPIVCPHCQSKFIYDFRSIFLVSGWWALLYILYFLHKGIVQKGQISNVDFLGMLIVIAISLFVRVKFATIKSTNG